MLKKFRVRRGCTVPRPLTWPSTKKSDGTETFAMSGSDGCSVLPQNLSALTCWGCYQILDIGVSLSNLQFFIGTQINFAFNPRQNKLFIL